jgi:hypothetical protein
LSLSGHTVPAKISGLGQSSAREGIPDLTITVTDRAPVLRASVTQGLTFQESTLNGLVTDQAAKAHRVRINFDNGTVQVLDLGVNSSAPFSATHTFA